MKDIKEEFALICMAFIAIGGFVFFATKKSLMNKEGIENFGKIFITNFWGVIIFIIMIIMFVLCATGML